MTATATATATRRPAPALSPATRWLARVLVPAALVVAWWFGSAGSTSPYYPPLAEIVTRFRELWLFEQVRSDVVPTLVVLFSGLLIGVALGVVGGLGLARMPTVRATVMPLITFYRALPGIALIPVLVQLFGYGDGVRVGMVVLVALPPTLIATMDGVLGLDATLSDVVRAYGLPRSERLLGVYLPVAGPQVFAGVQVSMQFAFIAAIAVEMVGSTRGIGYQTLLAQQTFASADMWAGVLLLGVVGFGSSAVVRLVRNRLLRWYDGAQAVSRAA